MPSEKPVLTPEIQNYLGRISSPPRPNRPVHGGADGEVFGPQSCGAGESSAVVRSRVVAARERQQGRFTGRRVTCNARMGPRELKSYVALDAATVTLLGHAVNDLHLSARAPRPDS